MLKVYSTLNRTKKPFVSRNKKLVKMFVCGPTVYEYAHIGHARSYIFFDVVARYLRFKGYDVFYLQNITDLGRKIAESAKKSSRSREKFVRRMEKAYFDDMKRLNISVDKYERSSVNLSIVFRQIKKLLEKGLAYKTDKGIYFDTQKFGNYGRLPGMSYSKLKHVEPDNAKKNPADFSLWKNDDDWGLSLKSPFGRGRPNWHILDTALIEKYFGLKYDIHGGGTDLIYPHHEALRATMNALSGNEPVNYWMNNEFVNINGRKMSKSLENFITIRKILSRYSPNALRLFFLSVHYRKPITYNEQDLKKASESLKEIILFMGLLKRVKSKSGKNIDKLIFSAQKNFESAMDDDFNTGLALKEIYAFISGLKRLMSKEKLNADGAKKAIKLMLGFDRVLAILPKGIKHERK